MSPNKINKGVSDRLVFSLVNVTLTECCIVHSFVSSVLANVTRLATDATLSDVCLCAWYVVSNYSQLVCLQVMARGDSFETVLLFPGEGCGAS